MFLLKRNKLLPSLGNNSLFWRVRVVVKIASYCRDIRPFFSLYFCMYRVLISPYPDQEGNSLGNMSGTRAISTTLRRELSSSSPLPHSPPTSPPPARQGAEGDSRHSDRKISLFLSWTYQVSVQLALDRFT